MGVKTTNVHAVEPPESPDTMMVRSQRLFYRTLDGIRDRLRVDTQAEFPRSSPRSRLFAVSDRGPNEATSRFIQVASSRLPKPDDNTRDDNTR